MVYSHLRMGLENLEEVAAENFVLGMVVLLESSLGRKVMLLKVL